MGKPFGFPALKKLLGELLARAGGASLCKTQSARDWSKGVLSVASSKWFEDLKESVPHDVYVARVGDMRIRVERDTSGLQPQWALNFEAFAIKLVAEHFPPCGIQVISLTLL
jgi:hypothetical protein